MSIEKLLPHYGEIKILLSTEDGAEFLINEMHKWLENNLNFLWKSIVDRRIIGLIVFSRYLALDTSSTLITTFNNTIFASRSKGKLKVGDW